MSEYFFVQSQDPLSESRCEHQYRLMASLAEAGHTVQVLLVQNGVMPARAGAHAPELAPLLDLAGMTVYADDYSLQQRHMDTGQLKPGVQIASVDRVISAMLAGHKVIWH